MRNLTIRLNRRCSANVAPAIEGSLDDVRQSFAKDGGESMSADFSPHEPGHGVQTSAVHAVDASSAEQFRVSMGPSGARVLFIHQNFPGQFRHIAADLAQSPGWQVLAIGRDTAPGMPGVPLLRYRPHRKVRAETHHYLRSYEDGVLHGQAATHPARSEGKGISPRRDRCPPGVG